jgi:hypothetical protein
VKRAVVFLGGTRDAAVILGRALPPAGKALAESGVLVPRAGRTGNKATGFTHQALGTPASPGWADLQAEVAAAESDTLLLVIPSMLRVRSPSRRVDLLKRLLNIAQEVHVVSVVADQLTLINDAYLAQVGSWRTSKLLEELLPRLLDNEAFAHETALRPWYGDGRVSYSAVPLPEFSSGNPVTVVLGACGLSLARTPADPDPKPPLKLGPVGVEASRLLATYLRAKVHRFDPSEPAVVVANRAVLARAEKLGWCNEPFWGWSRKSAEKALARFEASNHRFAEAVWGTQWTLPYPLERAANRAEFLELDAHLVDQVQRYVIAGANRVKRERAAAK